VASAATQRTRPWEAHSHAAIRLRPRARGRARGRARARSRRRHPGLRLSPESLPDEACDVLAPYGSVEASLDLGVEKPVQRGGPVSAPRRGKKPWMDVRRHRPSACSCASTSAPPFAPASRPPTIGYEQDTEVGHTPNSGGSKPSRTGRSGAAGDRRPARRPDAHKPAGRAPAGLIGTTGSGSENACSESTAADAFRIIGPR